MKRAILVRTNDKDQVWSQVWAAEERRYNTGWIQKLSLLRYVGYLPVHGTDTSLANIARLPSNWWGMKYRQPFPATRRKLSGWTLPINNQRPFSDSRTEDKRSFWVGWLPDDWKSQGCRGSYRSVILWATSVSYVGLSCWLLRFCHLQIKEPRLKSSLAFFFSHDGRIL